MYKDLIYIKALGKKKYMAFVNSGVLRGLGFAFKNQIIPPLNYEGWQYQTKSRDGSIGKASQSSFFLCWTRLLQHIVSSVLKALP